MRGQTSLRFCCQPCQTSRVVLTAHLFAYEAFGKPFLRRHQRVGGIHTGEQVE
jgi:hypothetical protein